MTENPVQSNDLYPLGKLRKSYPPRAAPGKVMLGVAIFCGVMSLVEFANALSKYLGPPNTVLSDRFRQDAILIAAILGGVLLLLGVIMIALYYTHIKHRVDLYEYGLVVVTWRGSTSFHWGEIDDLQVVPIYGNSRRPVNWNFTVTRDDGVKAQFRGLDGLESLGRIIEGKIG
jgi:hypothetical protein